MRFRTTLARRTMSNNNGNYGDHHSIKRRENKTAL